MTAADEWLEVDSLDLDAQGVARNAEGKVVFIEGALPGERVQVQVHRRKNAWEQASFTAMARESAQRVRPRCPPASRGRMCPAQCLLACRLRRRSPRRWQRSPHHWT